MPGRGLADPTNPFDELAEYLWVRQWFVHANSIRFASAMGGPDYATFENGWWELTTTSVRFRSWYRTNKKF
ncbi:MAG: hypothetical protein U0586_11690 [Candidatus Brocadiaceae bacterium]